MQTTKHIPVMLEQSINGMNIQKKGIYIDATYGFGGHSNKILSLLDDESRLFAVDKDINSIKVEILCNPYFFSISKYLLNLNLLTLYLFLVL